MKTFALLCTLLFALEASANFQSDLLKTKHAKSSGAKSSGGGESVHWTLGDWLAQKNKVSLMDQWLAAHSHQPRFDVNASARMMAYTLTSHTSASDTSSTLSAANYQADMDLWILNFNGEYQKTSDKRESFGGAGGIRLLGADAQSTSLLARYGWRRLNELGTAESWENRFVEGELQLYIVSEFGIDGRYRDYLPATSNFGTKLEGHKVSAGVFFEFAVIRIFAEYFQEPLTLDKSGAVTRETADGYDGGLRIFF